MRIVAYLNTKGGVGKTTSSLMTAEAALRAGFSASVLDADPQGSASEWAERAISNGTPLKFLVEDANRATLARKSDSADVDYLFIDTAPSDPAVIQIAADIADLVIIPTRSTPGDLDRAIQTYETIRGAAALMLWNVDSRHQLYKQARELLKEQEIATFNAEVPGREDVNKLWFTGLEAKSLYGYEVVFTELHTALTELFKEERV
ncbi:MAG TPA: ParA family protein [Candidatus Yaniella excrementigallinarum]|nr:ParA family protein [Candidatus Yaniella excrementigallinarum]